MNSENIEQNEDNSLHKNNTNGFSVLMVGTEAGVFKEGSGARKRIVEYGNLVKELHVVVFSKQKFEKQNFGNVFVYPTNSLTKFNYISDATRIGKAILQETRNKKQETEWIISTQDPFECGHVGYRISNEFKIPLHLQIHTDFLSPYFARESILNKIRVCMAKSLILQADGIRVVSERVKNSIIENCKLKIENSAIAVLPIFVDVEKIKNAPIPVGPKSDLKRKYMKFEFIVLMASRLTREKNIETALEALAIVTKEYRSLGLIIVGDGPRKKKLMKKAKKLGIEENVVFEEWTDNLTSYYKTADLFLLTSNYEGYGRTVVEAMAAGCPVVMTDVGLAGEVARDRFNAFVVPVGDRQKLYDAIRLLVVSPERTKDLLYPAEQTLKSFPTKEEYLEQYKKSWEMCLQKEKQQ